MKRKILLTGSEGLIGQALGPLLRACGFTVIPLDNRLDPHLPGSIDLREHAKVRALMEGCVGMVHLAAVSRVVWGERDPKTCQEVNVEALANLVKSATDAESRPWLIFASSREVYGQQRHLPVEEDVELKPMNVYARSKVAGEKIVRQAVEKGLRAAIIRLSNVFGDPNDHLDRVIPAFCRAAINGEPLRVDGRDHTFDFTYVSDVASGILSLVELLDSRDALPPPIHFTSFRGITLGEAALAIREIVGSRSPLIDAPPRNFDVARFVGDNSRAHSILGWKPQLSFEDAIERFTEELQVCA